MNRDQIIEIAVKAALDWQEEQRQKDMKSRKNKRLHNTRLLLKNYKLFKSHCENSIYKFSQSIDHERALDILDIIDQYDDKSFISSVKQSIAKTHIILVHIDTMVKLYKTYCDNSDKPEDQRHYRCLYGYYFEGKRMAAIAKQEGIEERTVQRDIRDACYKLGALIFGIDSLDSVS